MEFTHWKTFSISGEPKAQKRHRHRTIQPKDKRRKSFVQTYDPCSKEKEAFRTLAARFAPDRPLECPIRVAIHCFMPHAKTHIGTGKNAGKIKPSAPSLHIKKPDVDNLAKFVMDALTGLFWKDDSVIYSMHVVKSYSTDPMTVVAIDKVE